jgi:hypothetical protein
MRFIPVLSGLFQQNSSPLGFLSRRERNEPFHEVSGQAGAKTWDRVSGIVKLDGFVKSPDAALRFILPLPSQGQAYCGVRCSAPHSSGFARLACGLFTKPSHFRGF